MKRRHSLCGCFAPRPLFSTHLRSAAGLSPRWGATNTHFTFISNRFQLQSNNKSANATKQISESDQKLRWLHKSSHKERQKHLQMHSYYHNNAYSHRYGWRSNSQTTSRLIGVLGTKKENEICIQFCSSSITIGG